MFNRLPESNRTRQRRTGGFVVATVVHLVIIAFAVKTSGLTAAPAPTTDSIPQPIYIARTDPPPTPSQPITHRSATSADVITEPLPVIPPIIPGDIAPTIPAPGVMLDLEQAFLTHGDSRVARDNEGTPNVAGGRPLFEYQVEQAVVAIPGTAVPHYPSMLQSAGVEGDVRAQFVVDTLGRVEPGSFKMLESSHDLFGTAVRDALMRARYQPAKVGGRRVRQLVEQTFTFRITR